MSPSRKRKSSSRLATNSISHQNSSDVDTSDDDSKSVAQKTNNKKIWLINDLIESMKPSSEELEFRKERLNESDILEKCSKLFKCTKCRSSFNSLIEKHQKVPVHPILGVLMCQKCCDYYEDGEFSLDSEGEDKYCRWCGEGGTIFGCAKCISGFCVSCIKRHFKSDFFKKVQKDDDWLCFFCDPKPLWFLRLVCSQAIQASEDVLSTPASKGDLSTPELNTSFNNNNTEQSSQTESLESTNSLKNKKRNCRKRVLCTSSSDESESEAEKNSQKKLKLSSSLQDGSYRENKTDLPAIFQPIPVNELEKVLKLTEYQLSFGVSWSNKMLQKLKSPDFSPTNKSLAAECQKIKCFLSLLSTYLVQFCNAVNTVEKSLLVDNATKTPSYVPEKNETPGVIILQFLSFVKSQVKNFMEKDISFSDILGGFYEDDILTEIRKKSNSASVSNEERRVNCIERNNILYNDNENARNNEVTEEQKTDNNEGREKSENSLDLIGDQNSEMNSMENDKDHSSPNVTIGETTGLNTSDTEEHIQEILAILENA